MSNTQDGQNPQQEVEASEKETQEEVVPASNEETAEETQDELPEDTSDRTREQFEKLKKNNQELKKQLEEKEKRDKYGDSVFDDLLGGEAQKSNQGTSQNAQKDVQRSASSYSHLDQGQVDSVIAKYVDNQGNVDIQGLDKELKQLNQKVRQAEQRANEAVQTVQQNEQQRQVEEAHKEFPWLDPQNPNFDQKRFEMVRDRIVRTKLQGQNPRLKQIAKDFDDMGNKQTEEQKKQNKSKKQAASNVTSGSGQPRKTSTTVDELIKKSRTGGKRERQKAIKERIKRLSQQN